jgi:hypothetical protein
MKDDMKFDEADSDRRRVSMIAICNGCRRMIQLRVWVWIDITGSGDYIVIRSG